MLLCQLHNKTECTTGQYQHNYTHVSITALLNWGFSNLDCRTALSVANPAWLWDSWGTNSKGAEGGLAISTSETLDKNGRIFSTYRHTSTRHSTYILSDSCAEFLIRIPDIYEVQHLEKWIILLKFWTPIEHESFYYRLLHLHIHQKNPCIYLQRQWLF